MLKDASCEFPEGVFFHNARHGFTDALDAFEQRRHVLLGINGLKIFLMHSSDP